MQTRKIDAALVAAEKKRVIARERITPGSCPPPPPVAWTGPPPLDPLITPSQVRSHEIPVLTNEAVPALGGVLLGNRRMVPASSQLERDLRKLVRTPQKLFRPVRQPVRQGNAFLV